MTVKEFSEKYGVDYSTVYNATWLIHSTTMSLRYKQYDEAELMKATKTVVNNRISRHKKELEKAEEIMNKLS